MPNFTQSFTNQLAIMKQFAEIEQVLIQLKDCQNKLNEISENMDTAGSYKYILCKDLASEAATSLREPIDKVLELYMTHI